MMPQVSPCPLSAWMLPVATLAKPHPRATICSCGDGSALPPPGGPARPAPAGAAPPRPAAPARPAGGGPPARACAALANVPGTPHGVVAGTPSGRAPPPPNMSTTGTGRIACLGVLSVARIVTFNAGYRELSTRPTNCLVTIGTAPVMVSVVLLTVHVTFGMLPGRRP